MLSVNVCQLLLICTCHLLGETLGQIHEHFGRRVNPNDIENDNFIDVSTVSRLHCFALCARDSKCQHAFFLDRKLEAAFEIGREKQDEGYQLKCGKKAHAQLNQKNAKPKNDEEKVSSSHEGDGGKTSRAILCQKDGYLFVDKGNISTSHKDLSNEMVDEFVRCKYTVITQTGNEEGSGTDKYLSLLLTGEHSSYTLHLNNEGDEMEKGQNDTFLIEVRRELEFTRHSEVEVFYSNINKWFHVSLWNYVSKKVPFKLMETYMKDF